MLFYFLIFLRTIFTNVSWHENAYSPDSKPIFVMCFAPWCYHCRHNLPVWSQFAKEYENNSLINIGILNCTRYEDLCDLLNVDGYPTFLVHFHNNTNEITFDHTLESFRDVAQRIINLNQKNHYFQEKSQNEVFYPHFEFTFKEDDTEILENVSIALSYSDYFYNISYKMKYGEETSIKVFFDKDLSISYEKNDYSINQINQFLNDNQHPYLGEWSFRTLRRSDKKFVLLATDNEDQYQELYNVGKNYIKEFIWGSSKEVPEGKMERIFGMKRSRYPAIVIPNLKNKTYIKLENVKNEQEIIDFIFSDPSKYKQYDLDIYDRVVQNGQKIKKIVACFIIGMACLIAIAVFIYIKFFDTDDEKID
ncbi:hypothetical protein TRFO_30569 [Tritrichomonas foetus]|uniref:Thioredoxin domain-containing protein n=1 Tax=Tritrichomonas foetus TaxID=1144522 RepID=A0A1J4JXV7_9EUKA|nr:hypothetical protein TRFO_30569 [Tritrichomonas foetus]|eukprot:OHT02372.1 hypothetical protein TRFO_30569 [Tritrichomonas foetus]